MSAAKPYVVICHYQLEELEHGVAEHMRAGYVPTGSVSNLQNPEGEDFKPLICQAMVWQPGSGDRKPEAKEVPEDGAQPDGRVKFVGGPIKCVRHGAAVISFTEGPDPDGHTVHLPVSDRYWWVDLLGKQHELVLPFGTPGPTFKLVLIDRKVEADKTEGVDLVGVAKLIDKEAIAIAGLSGRLMCVKDLVQLEGVPGIVDLDKVAMQQARNLAAIARGLRHEAKKLGYAVPEEGTDKTDGATDGRTA